MASMRSYGLKNKYISQVFLVYNFDVMYNYMHQSILNFMNQ